MKTFIVIGHYNEDQFMQEVFANCELEAMDELFICFGNFTHIHIDYIVEKL